MRFLLLLISIAAFGQSVKFEPPRQPDGQPDLQGVWRSAAIVAAFNVEGQKAYYNEPGGASVIVDPPDGKLPYLPAARQQANDNHVHHERDPTGHCHMHGVPRSLVPPFPTEIVEDSSYVVLLSETEHDVRIIPLDGRPHLKNYHAWGGDSRGHWEGDTLVVQSAGFRDLGWLDVEGSPLTESAHITERYRRPDFGHLEIEVTIDDPKAYTKPWTVQVHQRIMADTELIEFVCQENEKDATHLTSQ